MKQHDGREVNCFIAYPEVKEKATAVLVIHEIFGLSDWVRGVADQLAEAGYIAIAPDLLSGAAKPDGGGTAELGSVDNVRKVILVISRPPRLRRIWMRWRPTSRSSRQRTGKLTVAGFCWGGGQSFRSCDEQQGDQSGVRGILQDAGPENPAEVERITA